MNKIHARLNGQKRDGGSLLIDVLIGMAIVALIALIAVSTVGQFREKAQITGMTEDAKSLGLAIEAHGAASGAYPTAVAATGISTPVGVAAKLTTGNSVDTYVVAGDGNSFSFNIARTGFNSAVYDSAQGGLTTLPTKS